MDVSVAVAASVATSVGALTQFGEKAATIAGYANRALLERSTDDNLRRQNEPLKRKVEVLRRTAQRLGAAEPSSIRQFQFDTNIATLTNREAISSNIKKNGIKLAWIS
jgi:hypothetical protein